MSPNNILFNLFNDEYEISIKHDLISENSNEFMICKCTEPKTEEKTSS